MITIDPATAADAQALAPLVYSSGPAAFDYVFLSEAEAFLADTLTQASSSFGFDTHFVARQQTHIIGGISLFTREEHLLRHNANVGAILRWAGWRSPLVLLRGLKVEKLIPAPPLHCLHVAQLGVAPRQRGQGTGANLLAFAAQQAQQRGIDQLSLDVAADNPRAEALYRRLGFELHEHRTSQIPGLADHSTLIKKL